MPTIRITIPDLHETILKKFPKAEVKIDIEGEFIEIREKGRVYYDIYQGKDLGNFILELIGKYDSLYTGHYGGFTFEFSEKQIVISY